MKYMIKQFAGVVALTFATQAYAADIYEPLPPTPLPQPIVEPELAGNWYIRGDLNWHWSELRGAHYITYGPPPDTSGFTHTDLDDAFSLGAGVGYQINRNIRTDITADYWFESDFRGSTAGVCNDGDPCVSRDSSAYSALLLMANAYVDLGTYRGITPYVGGGIGGAWVKWDDLRNEIEDGDFVHKGGKDWRFAWSLMAGASYCLTENLQLDAGYRFTRIEDGEMFEYGSGVGPGFDHGFNVHEARAGLRYTFGGSNINCAPQVVAYEPPSFNYEPPIYK